jgi:hypothetical protein
MAMATDSAAHLAGFWLGLWHGLIAPISLLVSLFNQSVSMYEVRNNGGWYNFGFMLGLSGVAGGGGSRTRRYGRARDRRPTPY